MGFKMRNQFISLLALAALILGGIFIVAPKAMMATNHASTEVVSLDLAGLTQNAKAMPVQSFPAH